uniref:Uncharacterized protein n=1 Tax=Knipowitschia caucasica TaxID=637954 RepID=A0AAV2LN30_KNICA
MSIISPGIRFMQMPPQRSPHIVTVVVYLRQKKSIGGHGERVQVGYTDPTSPSEVELRLESLWQTWILTSSSLRSLHQISSIHSAACSRLMQHIPGTVRREAGGFSWRFAARSSVVASLNSHKQEVAESGACEHNEEERSGCVNGPRWGVCL